MRKQAMIWATITESEEGKRVWYIPPAPPCNKGEIGMRLFGRKFVIGWGDAGAEAGES